MTGIEEQFRRLREHDARMAPAFDGVLHRVEARRQASLRRRRWVPALAVGFAAVTTAALCVGVAVGLRQSVSGQAAALVVDADVEPLAGMLVKPGGASLSSGTRLDDPPIPQRRLLGGLE